MWRKVLCSIGIATFVVAVASPAAAQTKAAKIAQAMAAGPPSITRNATIKDWPGKDGKIAVLREGTNDWVCLPSEPKTKYRKNDAMCMDRSFGEMIAALIGQRPPKITQIGYAYMLTTDDWGSNTDMMATAPTLDNQWHHMGPHVMLVYPDAAMLAGIPTRPSTMGPYVMAAGTPYAHVMWPVK